MTPRIKFDIDLSEPAPDPTPPPGGWAKPCGFEDHAWVLEVDEGRATIHAADPCDLSRFDPSGPTPTCEILWEPEDLGTVAPIPVNVTLVNDSTPSTPAGPAEYSFYIELRPPADSTHTDNREVTPDDR